MKLEGKHYAAIAGIIIIIAIVLISQFPLNEPTQEELKKQGFFEDTNNYYESIPDDPLPEVNDSNPTQEPIPLNFSIESTGCLGEIIDNAFVPDSRNPTQEQLEAKPIVTLGKGSIKIEFYEGMYCKGEELQIDSYLDPEDYIVVFEEETLDSTKFIYGPTGASPDDIWVCRCNYKTTVNVTGLEAGTYPILVEKKNGDTVLSEITIS